MENIDIQHSKKSPTGPTERTFKPEYLIARLQLTDRGPLGFGPIQFLIPNILFWDFPADRSQTLIFLCGQRAARFWGIVTPRNRNLEPLIFLIQLKEEIRLYNLLRLVVYPIIYRVFLRPRWCRISSINSIDVHSWILQPVFFCLTTSWYEKTSPPFHSKKTLTKRIRYSF